MGGDGAKDVLKVAALGGLAATGFGMAGMGPMAGMLGSAAGATGAGAAGAGSSGLGFTLGGSAPGLAAGGAGLGLSAGGPGAAVLAPSLGMGGAAAGMSLPTGLMANAGMNMLKPQPQEQTRAPFAPPIQAQPGGESFASQSPFMQPWWQGMRR